MSLADRRLSLQKAFEGILRRYELRFHALEGAVLDPLRQRVEPVLDELKGARDVAADVARYAKERVRERYLGSDVDPVVEVADRLIVDAEKALIEAKMAVAVAIAQEKRLAKQAEQQEANAAEWEHRLLEAVEGADKALGREALARKQEHLALAANLRNLWEAQRASVEKQKAALRRLYNAIERAKRTKNTIVAKRSIEESRRRIDEAVVNVEATLRTLDLLAHVAGALDQASED